MSPNSGECIDKSPPLVHPNGPKTVFVVILECQKFNMSRFYLFPQISIMNAALDRSLPTKNWCNGWGDDHPNWYRQFCHAVSTRNLDWRDSSGKISPGTSTKVSMPVADLMSDVSVKITNGLLCTSNTFPRMVEPSASSAKALGTIIGM